MFSCYGRLRHKSWVLLHYVVAICGACHSCKARPYGESVKDVRGRGGGAF